MSDVEILRQARELVANPDRWTVLTSARDRDGNPVAARALDAKCWCMAGAIEKFTDAGHFPERIDTLLCDTAKEIYGFDEFVDANDKNPDGHAGVIRIFDAAIAKAEAANA